MTRISVIICSKNRSKALCQALEAVGTCTFDKPWEILVVDNGSTDDTSDAARRVLEVIPVPSQVIYESKPGNGHGRNAAIAVARGEILFFTDDDCVVAPDALAALDKEFEDHSLGFVAGRINLFNPLDHLCCYFYNSKPITFRSPWFLKPGFVQGSNMAFRLGPLRNEVGGFDPMFGAGARFAGEDLELAMRFLLAGWQGKYSPDIVVGHNHGRSEEAYRRLEDFYDEGVGAYIEKTRADKRCGLLTRISIGIYLARLALRSPRTLERVSSGRQSFASTLIRR